MRRRYACQQTKLPVSALPAASRCLTGFSRHRAAASNAQTAALAISPRMLCVPRFDHPRIDACFCVPVGEGAGRRSGVRRLCRHRAQLHLPQRRGVVRQRGRGHLRAHVRILLLRQGAGPF